MVLSGGVYDKESLKRALITNGLGCRDSLKENSGSGGGGAVLDISPNCSEAKAFLEMMLFNSAVREIFLNRFTQMFHTYDNFIIQPDVEVYIRTPIIVLYMRRNNLCYILLF